MKSPAGLIPIALVARQVGQVAQIRELGLAGLA
jgi:hypothetical protein